MKINIFLKEFHTLCTVDPSEKKGNYTYVRNRYAFVPIYQITLTHIFYEFY